MNVHAADSVSIDDASGCAVEFEGCTEGSVGDRACDSCSIDDASGCAAEFEGCTEDSVEDISGHASGCAKEFWGCTEYSSVQGDGKEFTHECDVLGLRGT